MFDWLIKQFPWHCQQNRFTWGKDLNFQVSLKAFLLACDKSGKQLCFRHPPPRPSSASSFSLLSKGEGVGLLVGESVPPRAKWRVTLEVPTWKFPKLKQWVGQTLPVTCSISYTHSLFFFLSALHSLKEMIVGR